MKKNKIVLVVGGTSGIGKSVVKLYLEKKYKVYAIGKTKEHCEDIEKEFSSNNLIVMQENLVFEDRAKKIASTIEENDGYIDYLVNSVGTISKGGIKEESLEDWNNVISNNLTTLFNITKVSLPLLEKGEGKSIVVVSSLCSLKPCTSLSYSVSKAGTDMFVKSLAKDLSGSNIRVNAVNPGVVKSNLQLSAGLFENVIDYEKWFNDMQSTQLLNNIGEADDVAKLIDFLNSDSSKWTTGSIISIDGGRSIS